MQEKAKEIVCKNCRIKKPIYDFGIHARHKGIEYLSKNCRKCCSEIRSQYQRESRLKKSPIKFHQCSNDLCNYIWQSARGNFCSKCGSLFDVNEIDNVIYKANESKP